ncbi:MAG TPA: DNA-formamidopyrimidine glycosylase family protein [Anaeromyxobacteraceae bacterium]|nr:DNA-formamidopyrimidine glycosylase family protein [Anaeromyxobacteraceae bacterium]
MPELPDVEVYVEALRERLAGRPLERARLGSPFLLRTVEPPLSAFAGRRVASIERLGKRVVIGFEGDLFLVVHLMVAGRLHWRDPGAKLPGKAGLLALDFAEGTLVLTEAGSKRRASLHAVAGRDALAALDRGGIEPLRATPAAFAAALRREPHTLKRALTDPRLLAGIGGAYADEILHRARLSPMQLTSRLDDGEMERLREAAVAVLSEWTDRLRAEAGGAFPEKVTAFREGMAVHGRHRKPCPDCGAPIQRIVHAENETNYCPRCQTGGRILSDRSLARLLRDDWPRTVEEMEALEERRR